MAKRLRMPHLAQWMRAMDVLNDGGSFYRFERVTRGDLMAYLGQVARSDGLWPTR